MKKFWKLTNSVDSSGSTLILEGPISQDSWWGDEVTPQEFRDELKKITGNKLTVIINSGGGDVWAGISIHDALKELNAEVTVKVSGLAASIASVIAMAGDKIVMTPGSTMMIHRASMLAMGNADDMKKAIEMLETVEEGILDIYATRTGMSKDAVSELVNAETWMSAEKAVELGFADEVSQPKKTEDQESLQNVFAGNFAFSMSATKDSLASFVSKVADSTEEPEAPVEPEAPEEPVVTPPVVEPPVAPAEEVEPVEAEETEEVTEPPVETNNPVEEEIESMENNAQPGVEGVVAAPKPSQSAPVAPSMEGYLKSRGAVEDFAQILVAQAGNSTADVKAAWGEHLAVKMGVTNPEILLPEALITEIQDAFKEGGEIWNLVSKTGLTVFRAAWDTVTGEDSRAKGYNREDEADKAEELITIEDRVIRPQFIYKYITLSKEDVKENRDTGALVKYVLSELPRRIVREIERAIVIGDGRADGSDYKISKYASLKEDAADGVFAVEYTPFADESKYESLLRAKDLIKAEGPKWIVAKSGYMTDLLLEQSVNGGFIFAPGTDVARALGFAGVIEPDWLDDSSDAENDAYVFVPQAYKTVGDNSIEAFTNFVLKQNKQEYLQEIYSGGGLATVKSAVAITVPSES